MIEEMVPESITNKVFAEEGADYVTMVWSGYHNSKTFREGTEKMLLELTKHKAGKVLADIENMMLIGMEDQNWLLQEFLPKAIASGFRAIAIVKPVHYFNRVAVETIAYKVNQDQLKIQFFNKVSEAKDWLRDF
jgi:hypothetical protein